MDLTTKEKFYEFLPDVKQYEEHDTLPIRIIKGKYQGVDFRFQRVSLSPSGEELNVNFDVDFLRVPDSVTISLKDQELVDFLGEILYDILVNRDDINTEVFSDSEPIDLEDDVHEEPNGKNNP